MTDPVAQSGLRPLGELTVHYWYVQRMAKTCGVDPVAARRAGDISQPEWADMVQTCRSCQWTGGCDAWLNRLDHEPGAAPPGPCLNGDVLKSLADGKRL